MGFWNDVLQHMKDQLEHGEIRTSLYPKAPGVSQGTSRAVDFDVAHINEQGQNMIIILVGPGYDLLSDADQEEIYVYMQRAANSAGMAGNVVLVWEIDGGAMGFRAPRPWIGFFRSVSLNWVAANINKRMTLA